jgi:hypothetical protein
LKPVNLQTYRYQHGVDLLSKPANKSINHKGITTHESNRISHTGTPEGLYIFDTPDSATLVEMDEIMFIETYNRVIVAGGITAEITTILNSIDKAA